MLFPCVFGVFPRSQPRPQDFGRSYNPYGSFGAEVPKTLVRSALPSAVILDGEHLQPRPFHLLLFRPCRKSVTLRKPPDLSLCETRPKRGLRGGLWVFSRPRWKNRHTGRHGGSQGATSSPRYIRITGASSSSSSGASSSVSSGGTISLPARASSNFSFLSYELR